MRAWHRLPLPPAPCALPGSMAAIAADLDARLGEAHAAPSGARGRGRHEKRLAPAPPRLGGDVDRYMCTSGVGTGRPCARPRTPARALFLHERQRPLVDPLGVEQAWQRDRRFLCKSRKPLASSSLVAHVPLPAWANTTSAGRRAGTGDLPAAGRMSPTGGAVKGPRPVGRRESAAESRPHFLPARRGRGGSTT